MNLAEKSFGFELRTDEFVMVFGNKNAHLENLKTEFPELNFLRLKQIHSDAVVKVNEHTPDYEVLGDSHFTNDVHLALASITADCIPAFIFDSNTKTIAAVHAGWRGVASKIIPKTISTLIAQGSKPEDMQIFIGPHIQKKSFEVGGDVRDLIISSLGPLSALERNLYFENISETKALVDLHQVVRTQIQSLEIPLEHIYSLHIDTVSTPDFHSYRRDRNSSGRQLSFISLLK